MDNEMDFSDLREIAGEVYSPIVVKHIFHGLIDGSFKDIRNSEIVLSMGFSQDGTADLHVCGDDNGVAYMEGSLPVDLIYNPKFFEILGGAFAHEMSHIARGDHRMGELRAALYDGAQNGIESVIKDLPSVSNVDNARVFALGVHAKIERSTDMDAMLRGEGENIFYVRKYLEALYRMQGLEVHEGYFRSKKIAEIIRKEH